MEPDTKPLRATDPIKLKALDSSIATESILGSSVSLEESYRRLFFLATEHETTSSAVAIQVLLAAHNISVNKVDLHDLNRLDGRNTRAALAIIAGNLLAGIEACKYLTEDQIDRLFRLRDPSYISP